jgi:hypothetical protein
MMNVTVTEAPETHGQEGQEGQGQPVEQEAGGYTLSRNLLPLAKPALFNLPPATVTATVKTTSTDTMTATTSASLTAAASVTVRSNATALFVWLSTRAAGRFEDNAFAMAGESSREIRFIPFGTEPLDTALLTKSLRVEHLQQHLHTHN